ncbi:MULTISPECIES: dihydroxyacetone kinase subunit DhaK [Exiguobacterium]|uniref:dihydroxyacetone kinase subunit DhaK n=1 Tax=Exiguobacterium TaxID=33986 RepID=UPI000681F747|nr:MULTISPECIES: dihydroxyacetone kinase subunit DhaK [Exiguobacterium]KNH34194.1 dihydroxyacetone kinase [Exiguobacterium acetylicum]MCQ4090796.1 dihydroxyacetone kinase subunit DhaK [Exiguobacterium sp. LL15]
MHKLMKDSNRFVSDMVDGLVLAHPDLYKKVEGVNVVARKVPLDGKVGLVSGGGSGHEPAHAGFVGDGMLAAAVCGEVFTSPTPDMVLEGIKAAHGGKGVLLVVKNYSGDVMNFDMAKELAELEDIEVDTVVVNDDIAIKKEEDRRGVAGTVFVHKIAGAAAADGKSLSEVKAVAEKVIQGVRSIGMALSPCYMPESGKPGFELHDDEMEIGIGIHGEKGLERKAVASVDAIVKELLDRLTKEVPDKKVAVMVNGMGGTPESELYITYKYVAEELQAHGYEIARSFVGNYMTSLEMHGFSITLLPVDDELLGYLDAETKAIGF